MRLEIVGCSSAHYAIRLKLKDRQRRRVLSLAPPINSFPSRTFLTNCFLILSACLNDIFQILFCTRWTDFTFYLRRNGNRCIAEGTRYEAPRGVDNTVRQALVLAGSD